MNEIINKPTRAAYGEALVELGAEHKDVIALDADLAGATMSAMFQKAYPDRFIDCGIAESNMMGVAAGLATCGNVPFASTFAMFAAGRAYEQVRNSIGYPHLHVIIAGSHAGLSVGEDGATHQCLEDMALMRQIPGMTVICPADYYEMKAAVKAVYDLDGPCYLRLCRLATPSVHNNEDYTFEVGKGITMREGNDVTLVATGLMVEKALEAADLLAEQGVSARVIDMHTIKPIDVALLQKAACETKGIVTAEDHFADGGLGSAVLDALCDQKVRVRKVGVQDRFGMSGKPAELFEAYGLTAQNIVAQALAIVNE